MIATSDLSLLRLSTGDEPSRSAVVADGRRVVEVPGLMLKAQFLLGDGRRLIVTADDSIYEDIVTILLLSSEFVILDQLALGGAYGGGDLAGAISPVDDSSLVISFLGRWRVRVHASPSRFRAVPPTAPVWGKTFYFGAAERRLRKTFLEITEHA